MKKKYILAIFIFSIIIMIIGGCNGYIKGHDADFHAANISAISEKISLENLLVQEPLSKIAGDFGYGSRFFYPPLPHMMASYIVKILDVFGIDSISLGMRITEGMCFFASGITFFYLALKLFKNEKTALVLSFLYMAIPYHLTQVFIRDAFSEMFIPIAIPLIILGLLYLVENNYKNFLYCFVIRICNCYI